MADKSGSSALDLADYRRAVAGMYNEVREQIGTPETRLARFRRQRDGLFRSHPQSALSPERKASFAGLSYYPYDPQLRFILAVDTRVEQETFSTELSDDGLFRYQRVGVVRFDYHGQQAELSLFWVLGYGGGLYLPFRDQTNGQATYPGGRYLLDTIKHADLGVENGLLVVDFNYAYNPSCAYDLRWHCPLAPPENWLTIPIPAGEKNFERPQQAPPASPPD
jgi:uncharacterized protein (DUF1684 family)